VPNYCSTVCQREDWSKPQGGHKTLCKSYRKVADLFNPEAEPSIRAGVLDGKLFHDERFYQTAAANFPGFYKGLYAMILEDETKMTSVLSPYPRGRLNTFWTGHLLQTIFRNPVLTSATSFKGLNIPRFMAFVESNPDVWPVMIRVIILIDRFVQGPGGYGLRRPATDALRCISQGVAIREVSQFILVHHAETTADAMRILWESSKNEDLVQPPPGLAMEPLLYETIAILEWWSSMLHKHDLPGKGAARTSFIDRIGLLDDLLSSQCYRSIEPAVLRNIRSANPSSNLLS